MSSPPPAAPSIAAADQAPLRRLHFRLWQIAMTALTIILCGWFFWLGIVPGIVALFFAKHVLVAILVAGLSVAPVRAARPRRSPEPPAGEAPRP
jgi:hypothetical protein